MPDDDFDKLLEASLAVADDALNKGPYKKALLKLQAMSLADVRQSVPKVTAGEYSRLITLVELASAKNVAQEVLVTNIAALGKRAVAVAKLVPGLAGLPGL